MTILTLFSTYSTELNALRALGGITLRSDGPIDTFQTEQSLSPSIQTTTELDSAVASADWNSSPLNLTSRTHLV